MIIGVPVEKITKTYETNFPVEVSIPSGMVETEKPSKKPDANPVKKSEERDPDVNPVKNVEERVNHVKKPERDPDEPVIDNSVVGHKGKRSDPARFVIYLFILFYSILFFFFIIIIIICI